MIVESKPVEPKPAVVCVLRDSDGKVLMGRRNESLRFMGGHHVFPGGRVDAEDSAERVSNEKDGEVARGKFAAVRELFEETGILLAEGDLPGASVLRGRREELLAGDIGLLAILDEFDLHIDGARFEAAGHWITPEESPVRFDTQYYVCRFDGEAHGHREELIEGELTRLAWYYPTEARERWQKGEIRLSPPVSYTLQHLGSAEYPACLDLLNDQEGGAAGLVERMELRRGIYIVPLETDTILPATHTNCIIVGEKELLVIDPGSKDPEQQAFLNNQLDRLKALGSTVKAVVLTHSHRDHVEGVEAVRSRYGVPVWAHEKCDEEVSFSVDRHIEDNEVLELPGDPGWRLRALYTPGHDPGHLAFYEETTRTILCGDMIANPGTIVVSESFGGNMQDFMDSLARLIAIEDATRVVPSHGRFEKNPQEAIRKHLDHRLWREEKIRTAYEGGATTLKELLAAAYDDASAAAMPIAEHALKAHLARLGIEVE
jgi:glyoxylase-like metal-dependent hydrolase (beta-lactamase superfamily II)/8-oxo-dGTP pyrophosphatase MutT (NUDIX family)